MFGSFGLGGVPFLGARGSIGRAAGILPSWARKGLKVAGITAGIGLALGLPGAVGSIPPRGWLSAPITGAALGGLGSLGRSWLGNIGSRGLVKGAWGRAGKSAMWGALAGLTWAATHTSQPSNRPVNPIRGMYH